MTNRLNTGTRWIGRSSLFARLRGAVVPAIVCALVIGGAAGCQNGKCKSCLFNNKSEKEIIDDTTLGQSPSDPKPPAAGEVAGTNLDSRVASTTNSNTIAPTPVETAAPATVAATEPAPNSQQRIENAASSDAASRQPTLETPKPAESAQPQQYQSVSPAETTAPAAAANQTAGLGFAPSAQDHAANLSAEVKNEADALPAAPNTGVQIAPEKSSRPEPIPAAESTSPANAPDTVEDVLAAAPTVREPSWMRAQVAIDAAATHGPRVNLKGQVMPMTNTAATAALTAERANAAGSQTVARPATPAPAQTAAPARIAAAPAAPKAGNVVSSGQVSSIIPGMELGVIDLTK